MVDIYYAVISLTAEEVDDVIKSLDDKKLFGLSKWLADNKDSIYGELPIDWKPFEDKSISEIIQENDTKSYVCQTKIISDIIDEDCTNLEHLKDIEVFFIDVFAMYLQKYKNLAKTVDYAFRYAKEGKCCLLMNYKLPILLQDQLEEQYRNTWSHVLKEYEKGSLHRVAARVNDLNNFNNIVKKYREYEDIPTDGSYNALISNSTTQGIVTDDGKLPNLG